MFYILKKTKTYMEDVTRKAAGMSLGRSHYNDEDVSVSYASYLKQVPKFLLPNHHMLHNA